MKTLNQTSDKFYFGILFFLFTTLIPFSLIAQTRGLSVVAKEISGSSTFNVGKQYAVIIGVDRYEKWMPLKNAVAEAKELKRILSDKYYIDEFIEMYNSDANASNIRKLFSITLPAKLEVHDSLLIFYAGHGHLDASKSGFWIPVDGGTDTLTQDRWISNAQLRNYLGLMKAARILVMADSCFSGDLLNTSRGVTPTLDSAYYRQALQLTSRQVLSSGSSETVPDESEFARQLLSFLDRNTEPIIDTLSMYERIRKGITQTLPLFGTLPGNENGSSYVLFRKQTEPTVIPAPAPAPTPIARNPEPVIPSSPIISKPTMTTLHINAASEYIAWAVSLDKPDTALIVVNDGIKLPSGNWNINARLPGDIDASWSKNLFLLEETDFSLNIPALGYSVKYQLTGLQEKRTTLRQQLGQIETGKKSWRRSGGTLMGIGLAVSVVSYILGTAARSVYDEATLVDDVTDARNDIDGSNLAFQIGIFSGGTGLLINMLSYFPSQKKTAVEREIDNITYTIEKLEREQ